MSASTEPDRKAVDAQVGGAGLKVGVQIERKIVGRRFPRLIKIAGKHRRLGIDIPHRPGEQNRLEHAHAGREENVRHRTAVAVALDEDILAMVSEQFKPAQDVLGVRLHVGVGPAQNISVGRCQAGQNAVAVAPIYCHAHASATGILRQQLAQDARCIVRRAVIDQNDLRARPRDNMITALQQQGKVSGLVVAGNHDG